MKYKVLLKTETVDKPTRTSIEAAGFVLDSGFFVFQSSSGTQIAAYPAYSIIAVTSSSPSIAPEKTTT